MLIPPPACEYVGKQIAKCFTKCCGKEKTDLDPDMADDRGPEWETNEERKRREQEDKAYRNLNEYECYGGGG